MPSILNTPALEIPIHFFCLPVAQREILLVNVLTNPILFERVLTSALYHNDPVFPQVITLFHNYVLIRQMFARLAVPHLPIQITEAFNPACLLPTPPCLSCWWIEDSTGSWELSPGTISPTFSTQFSSPFLRSSAELTMAVTRWRWRFHSNQRVGYPNLELPTPAPLDPPDIPLPLTLYP